MHIADDGEIWLHGENVFQYLDRFDPASVPFEQVADRLRAELLEQQTMPEFEKWLVEGVGKMLLRLRMPRLRGLERC